MIELKNSRVSVTQQPTGETKRTANKMQCSPLAFGDEILTPSCIKLSVIVFARVEFPKPLKIIPLDG
jgi:hypothetical protein